MLKIKDAFLQRFYRYNLSGFEQMILLELAFRCNDSGTVKGIYYKEITANVGCSIAQFYNILGSLKVKGFIDCRRSTYYGDWDVTVLRNDFTLGNIGRYDNYSNLNLELFEKKEFRGLRAGARRLLMYFTFRVMKQKYNEKNIGNEENRRNRLKYTPKIDKYNTMAKEVGITQRACKEYVEELVKAGFISVGNKIDINDKEYDVITLLAAVLKTPSIDVAAQGGKRVLQARNHLHKNLIHIVRTICRRSRVYASQDDITDTAMLILQYKAAAEKKHKDIYGIIENAIKSLNDALSGRVVHSIVKDLLNRNYDESILVY